MVKVYSGPGCQMCRVTKMDLAKRGIDFVEFDIQSDPEAYDYVTKAGFASLPVVVPDEGEPFSGYRPDRLKALKATTAA